MEGLTGVATRAQVARYLGTLAYHHGRRILMADVNAAVAGALEGGATEVLVHDNHGSSMNLDVGALHPQAEALMGNLAYPRYAVIEPDADVYFCIGYHAKQGTRQSVRDHTASSLRWSDVWLNGVHMGELGLSAACAGYYGIPVGLVAADDKVCAEARALLGADVEVVPVKTGLARHAALLAPADEVRNTIHAAAAQAVRRCRELKPFVLAPPYELQLRYTSSRYADEHVYDGVAVTRVDGTTVSDQSHDLLALLGRL